MDTELTIAIPEKDIEHLRHADSPEATFRPYHEAVEAMSLRCAGLKVHGMHELDKMAEAKKARKEIVKLRNSMLRRHKQLKAYYLEGGRKWDAFRNQFLAKVEPMELWLKDQETFIERAEAAERKALHDKRLALFLPFEMNCAVAPDVGTMPEEDFQSLLADCKALADARIKREEEAAAAAAAEKERQRLLEIEAAELRKKNAEAEAVLAAERRKAQEAQQAADAALAAERMEVENAKRRERERVEAEERAALEAERAKQEAADALARAGDRDKLTMFTDRLTHMALEGVDQLVPDHLQADVRCILADAINDIHNLI